MSKHNVNTMASPNDDGLMLSGYQKKLKTMKKKFFVLYKDTQNNTARLEYYDNERKFKSGLPPKRSIRLRNCFSINRRLDTKHDFVIALSTKDGGFGIVLDNEDEMLRWLEVLISLQRANFNITEQLRPQYEHVWQVYVQRKGLAESKGIIGNYHVCLTSKSLTFVRIGVDKTSDSTMRIDHVEFQLTTIRRCGDSQCYFYMEVGRQSVIGPGELWMETEDSLTAQNMHRMILSAMSAKVDMNNMGPMQRKRSSSANEASKPINVLQIKQTYVDNKYNNSSPQTSSVIFGRERCDSLPTRNRTSSENSNHSFTLPSVLHTIVGGRNNSFTGNFRQHSYPRHSNSPPVSSTAIGCSESEESSISIDEPDDNGSFMLYRFNRSSEGVIPEENTDEIGSSDTSAKYTDLLSLQVDVVTLAENYVNMAPVIAKSQAAISSNAEEAKYNMQQAANVNSPTRSSPCSTIEFAECAVDHLAKILTPDDETPNLERPTRAYSIGSRNEHNRIFKQHMSSGLGSGGGVGGMNTTSNESEHSSSGRVRAFSVGSRAKIPRCDLQRGVLSPKLLFEHNQQQQQKLHCHSNNSSNSNINADTATPLSSSTSFSYNSNNNNNNNVNNNNLIQIYGHHHRDKKSISAPLLIHKSQNSVDRMSDLMEIDFSVINKQSSNSTNSRINLLTTTTSTTTITTTTTTTTTIPPAFASTTATSSSSSTSSLVGKTSTIATGSPISSTTTETLSPTTSIAFINNNNNNNINYHNNNYKQTSNPKSVLKTITQSEIIITSTTTAAIATPTTTATTTYNNSIGNNINNNNNNNNRNNFPYKMNNTLTATSKFIKPQQHQSVITTDNGYLEMKPVGIQNALPITITKTPMNIIKKNQKKQQQQQQQRNVQLSKQQQKPKTTTPLQLSNSTTINVPIVGYDVPPDRFSNTTNTNINANFTTPQTATELKATTTTNNSVLVKNKKKQLLDYSTNANVRQQTTLENDNDNNPKILNNDSDNEKVESNENDVALIISKLDNVRITKITSQLQQQQAESKLNKNIVSDEYMKLKEIPNSNNNDKTPTKLMCMPKLLQHDNEQIFINSQQNNIDEQQQQDQQKYMMQQQKCLNRKSTGSSNSTMYANNESGYEMLQIKSDSSLQAHKSINNNNNKKDNKNNKLPINDMATSMSITTTTTQRPRSTNCIICPNNINNSALLYSSSSTSLNSTSSQQQLFSKPTTPVPLSISAITATQTSITSQIATISPTSNINSINNCGISSKVTPTPPPTSRPSSVNLESGDLYYAKLDWPQCSNKDALVKANNGSCSTAAMPKTNSSTAFVDAVGGGCGIVDNNVLPTTTPSLHNVYAKIDFDHSDSSSSSSSKNI